MLLQGSYFSAVDLADIASEMDRREGSVMDQRDRQSHNVDDSGYFSVQVIAEALKVFNLEMVPLNSQRATTYRNDPTTGQAYICNHLEHWFAVRRIGFQWFTLNSLLPSPELITDMYLSLYFAQLTNDGYSIFVVVGELPPCAADEQLMQYPVDPLLAAHTDAVHEQLNIDLEIERAKAASLGVSRPAPELAEMLSREMAEEDEDLLVALKLSQQSNPAESEDDEMERQMQMAIQLSMQCHDESQQSSSTIHETSQDWFECLYQSDGSDPSSSSTQETSHDSTDPPILESDDESKNEIRTKRETFLKRFSD